jgi:hypothetical protein
LYGVLGTVEISQGQPRDPIQVVDDLGQQDVERVAITLPCLPDQLGSDH